MGDAARTRLGRVVVVGAGLAGLRACEGLRNRGFEGEMVLVGDELYDPYDRPPLSKRFLAGTVDLDQVTLRPSHSLAALDLERRRGPDERAVRLDPVARLVELASGEPIGYDGCVLATGSRARTLPGLEGVEQLEGVMTLRTIDDALRLHAALLRPRTRLVVIGAGFVGMEVAATARGLGAEITVVEPLSAPLLRALGPLAASACERRHRDEGVCFELGKVVSKLEERADGSLCAELSDGSLLETDVVLVAVGAAPNVEWLEGSGLAAANGGIACDARLQAAPGVVVAGDIASFPHPPSRRAVRLEHRTNAGEQGDYAASSLLGAEEPFGTVPYVWSDQYDLKIQALGVTDGCDEWIVVDGTLDESRFVAAAGRDGLLSGAVAFDMARSLMKLRRMLADPTPTPLEVVPRLLS